MIHIYHSCRNAKYNLKLFNYSNKNGQISLGKQAKCDKNSDRKHGSDKKRQKDNKSSSKETNANKKDYPEEPTTCCMSGCANCVWLEYAEKLSEYYKDGGEQAIKEIKEKITDENIKAFLLHELRMRNMKE